jgi:hypothetical protein
MGSLKMYGGNRFTDFFKKMPWWGWLIIAGIVIAISLGLGLGLGLKPTPNGPGPGNDQNLAITVNSTPYGCSGKIVGCIPTGAQMSIAPVDSTLKGSYVVYWSANGFDINGAAIKGTGNQPFNADISNIITVSADMNVQVSKMQVTVYLASGTQSGPANTFIFQGGSSSSPR